MEYLRWIKSLLKDFKLISIANFYELFVMIVTGIIFVSTNYYYVSFINIAALCRKFIEYGYSCNFYVLYFLLFITNYIFIQVNLWTSKFINYRKFNINQNEVDSLSLLVYFIPNLWMASLSYLSRQLARVTNMPSLFLKAYSPLIPSALITFINGN